MSDSPRPAGTADADFSAELTVLVARLSRDLRGMADATHPGAAMRILSLLDQHGACSVGRLAELDSCAQPTMTGAVHALVDRGWVDKRASPDDARVLLVSPTRQGLTALREVRAANGGTVAERLTRHHVSTEDLHTAITVLEAATDDASPA